MEEKRIFPPPIIPNPKIEGVAIKGLIFDWSKKPKVSSWIPVTETLPPPDHRVFGLDSATGNVGIGRRGNGETGLTVFANPVSVKTRIIADYWQLIIYPKARQP